MGRIGQEGLAWKVPWLFTVTTITGTLFIFPKQRDCTKSSLFSSAALCHLIGNFTIHHHTRLFSCGSQNSSLCLLYSCSKCKFLSKKKNSERQTKRLYKGARYSEHWGWTTTVRPGWNRFFQVTKQKRTLSPYPEAYLSSADKLWTLSLWWTFQLVWWEMVPVASHLLVFHMELLPRDSLDIPPHKRPDLLWTKTALWRGEWWFLSFPTISPVPRYSNTAMTNPLLMISPENWPDPLCFTGEMHVDMWSRSIPHHPA